MILPDVAWRKSLPTFRRSGGSPAFKVGIELKGWYLLSKEGEPSFRYTVTPSACADNDLLVIVPWRVKNVLSGHPVVGTPFIARARFAAEWRNYWWEFVREAKSERRGINQRPTAIPYATSRKKTNDHPEEDEGGNFGSIARIDLPDLKQYVTETLAEPVAGIAARDWAEILQELLNLLGG